jgi:hypothetical protein
MFIFTITIRVFYIFPDLGVITLDKKNEKYACEKLAC